MSSATLSVDARAGALVLAPLTLVHDLAKRGLASVDVESLAAGAATPCRLRVQSTECVRPRLGEV